MEEKETKAAPNKGVIDLLPLDFDLVKVMRWTFFGACLVMPYIYNSHRSERNVRKLDAMSKEVKDLRAEYITLKSEHMSASKQSDVAQRLAPYGLEEISAPPRRMHINK